MPSKKSIKSRDPHDDASTEGTDDSPSIAGGVASDAATLIATLADHAKKLASSVSAAGSATISPDQLSALKSVIERLLSDGHLDRLAQESRQHIDRLISDFPLLLKEFCESKGIDLQGGFPDFILNGTIYLRVNKRALAASINETAVPFIPIEKLFTAISTQLSQAKTEQLGAEAFLNQLWETYAAAVATQDRNVSGLTGQRLPIFVLLPMLALRRQSKTFGKNPTKEHFKSYSSHAFRADLFRLLSVMPAAEINGHRLVIEPTTVAEDGIYMYLPTLGRCGFVGRIWFAPTAQSAAGDTA